MKNDRPGNPTRRLALTTPAPPSHIQSASPLDVLLTVMRDAHETARRSTEARKRLERVLSADNFKNREVLASLDALAQKAQDRAVEIAAKAAPYVHPRLAAQSMDLEGSMNFSNMTDEQLNEFIAAALEKVKS